MKSQFLADTSDTFKTYVYEHNRKVVPTSATLTVYKPGSETKLIDGVSMSIAGDGLLSYELTVSDNTEAGLNYKTVIAYVHGGTTHTITLFYDVVLSRLVKVVTDEDVIAELPQLKDNGWRVHGSAESGSTTTIVDAELGRYDDDYFTGGLAYSIDKDETREITDFDSSTATVTTSAFSSAISTDKYVLARSFSREIGRAFEKVEEKLIRLGKRPHLILDPYDLREVHIQHSVAEICKGLVGEEGGLWWGLWNEYEKRAEETFKSINFKYDESEDGYIAGVEVSSRVNVVKAGRR